jgi:5'-3' exonuclease
MKRSESDICERIDVKPTINIIDGNYFVNYATHSAVMNLKSSEGGHPTGALHVFLNTLWSIQQKLQGSMIVVFDGGRAAFRTKLYPEYKEGRPKKSDSLDKVISDNLKPIQLSEKDFESVKKDIERVYEDPKALEKILKTLELSQEKIKSIGKDFEQYNRERIKKYTFETLESLLPIMGIPTLRIPEEEADDIIYILTKKLMDKYSVYCITSDEDFVQMARLGATVLLYRQDETVTAKNFKDKYGFDLNGFTLYKSLKGDTSDNIKGVPSVGTVNAAKIVKSLSEPSIPALFDFCNESKDKKHQAVMQHFRTVKRNMILMDLEYIDTDEDMVMECYEKMKKEAVLNFPLVKKIFYNLELQTAGIKWLSELMQS